MTLFYGSVYSGTLQHELHHVMSYSFPGMTNAYDFYWYIESSANWFAGYFYEDYYLGNSGIFFAVPYVTL